MARILITYYSRTGHAEAMAHEVERGAAGAGAAVDPVPVGDLPEPALLDYDGVIIGSPAYYGLPAAPIKDFLDASVAMHGRLEGTVGGAFATAANVGGGNETTILALLQAMLVHGMIIQGSPQGDHWGPVAIGAPDDRACEQCRLLGERVARLADRLSG